MHQGEDVAKRKKLGASVPALPVSSAVGGPTVDLKDAQVVQPPVSVDHLLAMLDAGVIPIVLPGPAPAAMAIPGAFPVSPLHVQCIFTKVCGVMLPDSQLCTVSVVASAGQCKYHSLAQRQLTQNSLVPGFMRIVHVPRPAPASKS